MEVELRIGRREMRRDGANHHEQLGYREFHVQLNLPSPIWQVWVPICHAITPIDGLPNPIRQMVPLICHIRFYPSHCSHLHPPSLSFSSTTLPSSQNTMLCHPSLPLHSMITNWHWVQHALTTAYHLYSIHRVQHTMSTAYTEYSIPQVQHPPTIVCVPFILMITCWPLNVASVSGMPPYMVDRGQQPARPEGSQDKLLCPIPTFASQLTEELSSGTQRAVNWLPPSTRPISFDHSLESVSPHSLDYGLAVRTIMASKCISKTHTIRIMQCISKFTQLRPQSVSPNMLYYCKQVRHHTLSIMISECISKFTPSRCPSVPANTLD